MMCREGQSQERTSVYTTHIVGMIQRAQSPDRYAEAIAARIASAVRPWRIVLFGSRARGDALRGHLP